MPDTDESLGPQRALFASMLFNNETTNRSDYKFGKFTPNIETKYKERKKGCLMVRPPPLKDVHAMTDWKIPKIPFDLFGKAKPIVRTNPHDVQKYYSEIEDIRRKEVQMRRPRLVMTPALSIDDVDDEMRERMIAYVYKTTAKEMMSYTDTQSRIMAPLSPVAAPPKPITLPKTHVSYVPPEWRMESITWDAKQLRGCCKTDEHFWLARNPKCIKCDETKAVKALRKNKMLQ